MNEKNRKAMFAKKNNSNNESFYKSFWNNGAEGLYEWYDEFTPANLSRNDKNVFDQSYENGGSRPDWNEISKDGQNKLKKSIVNINVLKPNPKLIEIKSGWTPSTKKGSEDNTGVYYYIDPNSYKDLREIPESVREDILKSVDEPNGYIQSTTFKEKNVTIDDLRKVKTFEAD